jgi:hypothetical protein
VKDKKCRVCKKKFTPWAFAQIVCSIRCSIGYTNLIRKNHQKKQRALDRVRKEELKTKSVLTKEAQKEFNKYVRARDAKEPCISCSRTNQQVEVGHKTGGFWDCGHYLTVGGHPELRFNEDNAHKQCKACNGGSGKYTGKGRSVSESYDTNILKKIGPERLALLKGPNPMPNHTRDELRAIRDKYRKKNP